VCKAMGTLFEWSVGKDSTWVGFRLACDHKTRAEMSGNDKHTRGLYYKTYNGRNLRIFVIS
jgi:hypothetical protein